MKIISFRDVGGHQKYSKTLVRTFMTNMPDYAMLVINGCKEKIGNTTKEHFRLANALQIPIFIVITHLDRMSQTKIEDLMADIREMKNELEKKYHLIEVRSMEDVLLFTKPIKEDIIPIFMISCVSGVNLNLLSNYLHLLPVQNQVSREGDETKSEFLIHVKFNVGQKIILAGSVTKGTLKKKKVMHIGPDENGDFK